MALSASALSSHVGLERSLQTQAGALLAGVLTWRGSEEHRDVHGRHSREEDCNGLELHDEDLVFELLPGELVRW